MASAFLSLAMTQDTVVRRVLLSVLFIATLVAVATAVLVLTSGSPSGIETAGNSWSGTRFMDGSSWS
jgi:hypothetical protein